MRCHACTAVESMQRKHEEKKTRSLFYGVRPDEGLTYAMEHPLPYAPPTD